MEKLKKVIFDLEHVFVDDFEKINSYRLNLNMILEQMEFNGFNNYNHFCIQIKNNVSDIFKNEINTIDIDRIISISVNRVLKNKIRENRSYKKKLVEYFNDKEILKNFE